MSSKIIIPHVVTLTNLLLGIISLLYTMNQQYQIAAAVILIAVIMDGMDGRIARKLDVASSFWKRIRFFM